MKFICLPLVLLALTFQAKSAFITNDDISSIDIVTPKGWTFMNESALFDGDTRKRRSLAFRANQQNSDSISAVNPLEINVSLTNAFNIDGFSFFNDWGYHLKQQVVGMDISFFDAQRQVLFSYSTDSLLLDRWEQIDVFTLSDAIQNVSVLRVLITRSQSSEFEIRELLFQATQFVNNPDTLNDPTANVAAPAMFSGLLLLCIGLFVRRGVAN
ncbi:hypothetical protein ACFO4O_17665 [Glaciecola siphonariae]|uniref:Uncharacterized protein n=1 Tax=Glaciecola siphonariae TaxID=521012 RepID=A0ABV9LZJ5_9ALTE